MTHLRLEGSPRAFLWSKGYELQWLSCAGTTEFVRERWNCSTKENSPVHPSCSPDVCWTSAAQLVLGDQSIPLGCKPQLPVTHSNQALCSSPPAPFSLLLLIFGKAIYPGLEALSSQRVPAAPHVAHTQAWQKHSFATQKTTSLHQQQPLSAYKPPKSTQLIPSTVCGSSKKPACLPLKISHQIGQGVPICSWPAKGHPTSPHCRVQRACPQLCLCSHVHVSCCGKLAEDARVANVATARQSKQSPQKAIKIVRA